MSGSAQEIFTVVLTYETRTGTRTRSFYFSTIERAKEVFDAFEKINKYKCVCMDSFNLPPPTTKTIDDDDDIYHQYGCSKHCWLTIHRVKMTRLCDYGLDKSDEEISRDIRSAKHDDDDNDDDY